MLLVPQKEVWIFLSTRAQQNAVSKRETGKRKLVENCQLINEVARPPRPISKRGFCSSLANFKERAPL